MEIYENEQNKSIEEERNAAIEKEKTKSKRKSNVLLSSMTGAIIGSAITLFAGSSLGLIASPLDHKADQAAVSPSGEQSKADMPVQTTSSNSNGMVDTIDQVSKAVVGVVNYQQREDFFSNDTQDTETGTGSGVIFKKTGDRAYIVTNNHVIEGANKVEVTLASGQKTQARIVGADPLTDLAVLEIESKYVDKVASFGDSSKLRPGEQVTAIGNPLGLQFSRTVTQGIVSGTERTIPVSTSEGEWDLNVIQTDAAINPGNSGGALINSAGQVIGINSLKISQSGVEGLGFAIPSNDVIPMVNDLMKNGKVKRPYIGIGLENVSELPPYVQREELNLPSGVSGGVVVTGVEPFSPGAEAGLKEKDVIVSINGTDVKSIGELRKYIYTKAKVGERVQIELYRGGRQMNVSLKMSERGTNQ
ncbi:S1C family serine protease [Bacillus songklensis]|uniref:S1C family serine protease n=1 Tax=Bacillus songklensis TaxID=1069116 RepID=A0ABV8AZ83_9BACI